MSIEGIVGTTGLTPPGATRPAVRAAGGATFGDTVTELINSVDHSSADANKAIGRMLDGSGDVHEAVIAVQKSDTLLQLTVQIRNKLVQAYHDIMRMPV